MKIRIKFAKQGQMKFIGHLDMMRYFQKAIRRADIDICYSEGFSPHQKMSFAAPLGVGILSRGEYFDIEVNSTMTTNDAVKALNDTMVEGVEVLSYRELPDTAKNCMAIIAAADYLVHLKNNCPEINKNTIDSFINLNEINIVKKTKKSEKEVNIKPLIYEMELRDDGLFMKVASGSANNLKPDLVTEALAKHIGIPTPAVVYERLEMYADISSSEKTELVSLESLGDIIE